MVIELKQRSPLGAYYRTPLDVFGPGVAPGPEPAPPMRGTVFEAHNGGVATVNGPPTTANCFANISYNSGAAGNDSFVSIIWERETSPGVWTPATIGDFVNYVSGYRWRGNTSGAEYIAGGPAPVWCQITATRCTYYPGWDSPQTSFFQGGLVPSNRDICYFFGNQRGFQNGETVSFVSRVPQTIGAKVNQVGIDGTVFLSAPNPTACTPGATFDINTPGSDMYVELQLYLWDGDEWIAPSSPTDYIDNFRGVSVQAHQSGVNMTLGGNTTNLLCAVTTPADRVIYDPPYYGVRQQYNGAAVPRPEDRYWIQNYTTAWILNETVYPTGLP